MRKTTSIYLVVTALFFMLSLGIIYVRWDLTSDKRYTLTESSKKVLQEINIKIFIDVYLDGEFPASFKQLQKETKNMLLELQHENPNIDFRFIDPIKEQIPLDTLQHLGIQPSVLPDVKQGKITEILLYPYAVIKNKNKKIAVSLLSQKREQDPNQQLNTSIEELEFKFIQAIDKTQQKKQKKVGFLVHHQEIRPKQFDGFMQLANKNYQVGPFFPQDTQSLKIQDIERIKQLDVLVIAKPQTKFNDQEKVVLDQYLMNGGKLFWMLDPVNAEMDSLFRSDKILAFPQDLNLTDYFFSYGIRINNTLLKDYQRNAPLRLVTGEIQGNAQYSNLQWSYFPLGIAQTNHEITKNINPVKFEFISPIELLPSKGIKQTILYQTSDYTTIKQTPNYIELVEIQQMNDSIITDKFVPSQVMAVLLEGNFQSAYKDRIENQAIPNFKNSSTKAKMIVVSDGDVAKNGLYQGEPVALGLDLLTNKIYGNPEFIENSLEYLTDETNLMSLRNRTLELKLLDAQEILKSQNYWKYFNLIVPLLVLFFLGISMFWIKKRVFIK